MNCETLELASGTSIKFDHLHKYLLRLKVFDLQLCVMFIGECRDEWDKECPQGALLLLGKDKIYECTNNLLELNWPICQIEYFWTN